ncbi:type IV secretion system protein VirB7 [Helicobacter pylori]|nr:type IV secretion system protein VirB7 [Helicobacter pylori]
MKKMQYLAFILVAVLLNACSDKFIEMKKSPCALKCTYDAKGGLYV